jgi:hypothetical protein
MNEPFPAGTRFLVGIVVQARTFEAARTETLRIVGDEAEVRYVFGRINEQGDEASVPQVITNTNLDGPLI